ncbi:hypothetical protein B296_00014259 [Ensete ventricosum]|uniref:Uncharacterized protein n=1 Tax=Ensete ventricosum TaxID=4639 RepID=A0A427ACY8_ENSVE|nr:hypothetical protein B296_00014259 [Ensete ventricosum]
MMIMSALIRIPPCLHEERIANLIVRHLMSLCICVDKDDGDHCDVYIKDGGCLIADILGRSQASYCFPHCHISLSTTSRRATHLSFCIYDNVGVDVE